MSQIINKGDFAKKIAEKKGISQNKANELVNDFIGAIQDELVAGNAVNLTGFGKFSVAERAARTGRNPGTKETIQIPAKKAPKFSAGKALKDAVI